MWPDFYYMNKKYTLYSLLLVEGEKSLEDRVFNSSFFYTTKSILVSSNGKFNLKLQH